MSAKKERDNCNAELMSFANRLSRHPIEINFAGFFNQEHEAALRERMELVLFGLVHHLTAEVIKSGAKAQELKKRFENDGIFLQAGAALPIPQGFSKEHVSNLDKAVLSYLSVEFTSALIAIEQGLPIQPVDNLLLEYGKQPKETWSSSAMLADIKNVLDHRYDVPKQRGNALGLVM